MSAVACQVFPSSQRDAYPSGSIIDFVMTSPGMNIALNSLRVSGILTVGGIPDATKQAFYDSSIGVHAFFNNLMVSTANQGVLENRSYYPRMVAMKRAATLARGDIVTSARSVPELVAGSDAATASFLCNRGTGNPIVNNGIAFSFAPEICLNAAVSADGGLPVLDYGTTGDVRLSMRIVQPAEALYGADVAAATTTISISDLRLDWVALPVMAAKPSPVTMTIITEVKQVVASGQAQIACAMPLDIVAMSGSFQLVANELSTLVANTALERPPGVSRVYFQLNDVSNALVGFPLETAEDILETWLASFPESAALGKNDITLARLSAGGVYGVGIAFAGAVQLASANFGIQIVTGITGAAQMYVYLMFRSYLTV